MLNKILPAQLKPGAFALMALMAATRFHHFGDIISLPDASLAVFFLGGLWFGGLALFIALLVEAGLIDYLAITQFGVSDFCISQAYVFLIPTYAAVWFGGRYSRTFSHQVSQFASLVVSVSLAFLISNGSFYLLSGRYPDSSWAEYTARFMRYYPPYLQYTVIYVVAIYALTQLYKQATALAAEKQLPKA